MIAWFLIACSVDVPLPDTGAAGLGWAEAEPLPFPRQEHGVVVAGGELLVVGGVDDAVLTGNWVHAYDPTTDAWRTLPSLPQAVHHPVVAALDDGSVLVLGGLDAGFGHVAAHWRLPPDGAAWQPIASPAADRIVGGAGAAVLDGVVHVVGGLHDRTAVAFHSTYDPATDTWAALPDAPSARDHHAVAALDGRLVVAAGRQEGLFAFVASTEVWSPSEGWGTGSPIPTPRGGVAAAVLDGELHVLGGEGADTPDGVFATHEVYDVRTSRWRALPDMPTPRHGMGAALLDGALWVPGGAPVDGFGAIDLLGAYRP